MEERNVEKMEAALNLLVYLMRKEVKRSTPHMLGCDDLNMVLVVAGYAPINFEDKEVEIIDTVRSEG